MAVERKLTGHILMFLIDLSFHCVKWNVRRYGMLNSNAYEIPKQSSLISFLTGDSPTYSKLMALGSSL